ncbi:MAG: hypothetical protein Ct9H90mP25_4710 [Gammaproteobacteria bacterium]|nr:MAG: hypothetical protein Ct9H90mP25_4710 [Gammaproteobacteria bacterium]
MSQTADEVTFHKDIEPILQRSCQSCHREGGAGPMPLVTYEQVAPFAGLIEYKTGLREELELCHHGIWKKILEFKIIRMTLLCLMKKSQRYQAGPEMELQKGDEKMHPKHLSSMIVLSGAQENQTL